ncbi:unnamed protein product [Trifolium pratense]|uniref:Uncharacterized protein n=1 Tax=Trifolium pratense TaxID=57577 RepID=A0ACB0IDY6_TRIPR|nr:unnamed protein product [Trifolium pratense]
MVPPLAQSPTAVDYGSPFNHSNVVNDTKAFLLQYRYEILKVESEIDQCLKDFRKSQKREYQLAEEKLRAHVKYLQNLSQQLNREKSELASQPDASHASELFQTVEKREEELRQGMVKFQEMKETANGFGRTPKTILEKHFGL